eukprot:SAG22_NODE_14_length_33165_cov_13.196698_27_plen_85_part_00
MYASKNPPEPVMHDSDIHCNCPTDNGHAIVPAMMGQQFHHDGWPRATDGRQLGPGVAGRGVAMDQQCARLRSRIVPREDLRRGL